MNREDLLKMHTLTETAYKLNQEAKRFSDAADWTVRCAVSRLYPALRGQMLHNSRIDLLWDGVLFSYDVERNVWGFGVGEDDTEASRWEKQVIRMTYKEVFGWDHDPTQPIPAKWAYEYLDRVLDGFKPQPKHPNYDI